MKAMHKPQKERKTDSQSSNINFWQKSILVQKHAK